MSLDTKAFFHEWCTKNRVEPQFETRPSGEKDVMEMFGNDST